MTTTQFDQLKKTICKRLNCTCAFGYVYDIYVNVLNANGGIDHSAMFTLDVDIEEAIGHICDIIADMGLDLKSFDIFASKGYGHPTFSVVADDNSLKGYRLESGYGMAW